MRFTVLVVCILYATFQIQFCSTEPVPDPDVWTETLKPIRNRRNYGESCNKTRRCDKKAWLNCIDGKCDCMQVDEMIYSTERAKCVSKSGERCIYQINNGGGDDEVPTMFEKIDCVNNARCASDGTCACLTNFYEAVDGNCNPKAKFNELCVSDYYCSDTMSCINSVCDCDSSQILHSSKQVCMGKAGYSLGKSITCVPTASLNNEGICICEPKFTRYAQIDGTCSDMKIYGDQCKNSTECRSEGTFFQCLNEVCACDPAVSTFQSMVQISYPNPYETNEDESSENYYLDQCVGLAGSRCGKKNRKCVENSECDEYLGFCVCNDGYYKTASGVCGLGYGQDCSSNYGRNSCGNQLVCKNGECRCPQPQHQIYNELAEKCLSLVHGTCIEDTDCVHFAVCSSKPGSSRKRCQCRPSYVETSNGDCSELAFGAFCRYTSPSISPRSRGFPIIPCDTLAGLECIDNRCACLDSFTHFNSTLRKCLGLAGSRCAPKYIGGFPRCVPNAECKSGPHALAGTCECLKGFNETDNFFCVNDDTKEIKNDDIYELF